MVPVVIVDFDPAHRMMSTIRHNRARGTHAVLPMAEIVRTIAADGVAQDDIMRRLGMEDEEVERLIDRAGMPEQVARERQEFGKAWVPQG
jgi:ParB-like chromosome segregation protein Spo0J